MLSFAHATHHEATKSRSVTARAGTRECKEPSAPGEVPVKALSDGGSTPPISTNKQRTAQVGGPLFVELWGELNHVRIRRWRVHSPVRTLANTFIFRTLEHKISASRYPCENAGNSPPYKLNTLFIKALFLLIWIQFCCKIIMTLYRAFLSTFGKPSHDTPAS